MSESKKQEKVALIVRFLCVAAAATAASQWIMVKTPAAVGITDLLMGLAFTGVVVYLWVAEERLRYPALLGVALVLYALAALFSRSGITGAVEIVQRVAQLFCGVTVFGLLLRDRPRWLKMAVGLALLVNLVVAAVQVTAHDFSALTGLFGSRMIFSYYLAIAIVWLQPFLLNRFRGVLGTIAVMLLTTVVLLMIANGQMLAIACLSLLVLGFFLSRRCLLMNCFAILLLLLSLPIGTEVRKDTLLKTLSPFSEAAPKQAHTEVVAAVRMAVDNPWTGVGPGHYQDNIGAYYRELPNPNVNSIERDTQSGLGILIGTAGFPAAIALLMVLLGAAAISLKSFFKKLQPEFMAGAAALGVILAGMLISDPFVRGVGWFTGLALASVFVPASPLEQKVFGVKSLSWHALLFASAVFGLLTIAIVALGSSSGDGNQAGFVKAEQKQVARTVIEKGSSSEQRHDVFTVIEAKDALRVVMPARLKDDPSAAGGQALVIPDETGTPPAGEEPDLKYGGAEYEIDLPAAMQAKIWLRVWWEGSCANTLSVRTEGMEKAVTVGNDGTYNVWHWLEAPLSMKFDAGKNKILILNREDGIRLDQILVTTDQHYVPQGIEQE